jgi:hypothetical protein
MAGSDDEKVYPERDTPDGVSSRRAQWVGWQQAHQQALTELQTAEAAYYRLTAEQAFGRGDDDVSRARRLEALTRLETLRMRLDEIRGHQPPWPY